MGELNLSNLIGMMLRREHQLRVNDSKYDIISMVVAWESGEIVGENEIKMFTFLTEQGLLCQLGDSYTERAKQLGFVVYN